VNAELTTQIENLSPGDHLCLFYDKDPAEQMPALIPFTQQALVSDEQFIYIADDQTTDHLASHLKQSGIDVAAESKRSRLLLWTRKEWRQPGELNSDKKAAQVRHFISQAARLGFKGIRFAVEMTWTLGPDIRADKLEHWEATINTLFEPTFPVHIICQYNRSRLSPDIMLAALHTHPVAIVGQNIFPNSYYQAPLLLKEDGRRSPARNSHPQTRRALPAANGNGNGKVSAERVEWMLSQLRRTHAAEKSRAEAEALSRTQDDLRHFAAIVESSDDAILSKDLNGVIRSWNNGAQRIFGYSAEEVIGRSVTILIPEDNKNEEANILARLRRGERIDHYETVRQRKDGSLVDISLTVSPIKDDRGTVIGASKIARDITERRQAEEAIRQAKEELARVNDNLELRVKERTTSLSEAITQLEEFSYTVSHDLRAPARAMKCYAQVVLDDFGENLAPEARDYLDRIIRGGARMDALVQDVLTYSRLSRRELELLPVHLNKVVPEIIQQYPELQPPRAQITVREPLLPVLGHEPLLAQAISNLLTNAAKFMPPGEVPRITVRTEARGANVRLWVEDNGIGIKPEHQPRVFGIFERLTNDPRYEGTGIGLAIVRKAADKMGGAVGLESDGLTGSRFWIDLSAV